MTDLGLQPRKSVQADVKRKCDMLSVQIARVLRMRIELGSFQVVFLLDLLVTLAIKKLISCHVRCIFTQKRFSVNRIKLVSSFGLC